MRFFGARVPWQTICQESLAVSLVMSVRYSKIEAAANGLMDRSLLRGPCGSLPIQIDGKVLIEHNGNVA